MKSRRKSREPSAATTRSRRKLSSRSAAHRKVLVWIGEYVEEVLVVGLLAFLVCAVSVEVFRRYILNNSGPYSEEIARFAMIWMVYLGVPYAIKQRRHIICD